MKNTLLSSLLALPLLASNAGAADFDVQNPAEFSRVVAPGTAVTRLARDMQFTEGPVWLPAEAKLVFSDIPADELKEWTAAGGLKTFRKPSGNANGNTIDRQGRLISCEHSGRRVSRAAANGSSETLVDLFEGKKFNSPNDAAVKSDGTIWFTDPDYGLGGKPHDYEGCFVFRFDPATGRLSVLVRDFDKPNGICFSPDETRLYVADSGKPRHIRVFQVKPDGTVDSGRVFCTISKGVPDGIRCDAAGRLYSSAGDGVQVFSPEGERIGTILVPESPANLCFGGKDGKKLFITARKSLYCVPLQVAGARPAK